MAERTIDLYSSQITVPGYVNKDHELETAMNQAMEKLYVSPNPVGFLIELFDEKLPDLYPDTETQFLRYWINEAKLLLPAINTELLDEYYKAYSDSTGTLVWFTEDTSSNEPDTEGTTTPYNLVSQYKLTTDAKTDLDSHFNNLNSAMGVNVSGLINDGSNSSSAHDTNLVGDSSAVQRGSDAADAMLTSLKTEYGDAIRLTNLEEPLEGDVIIPAYMITVRVEDDVVMTDALYHPIDTTQSQPLDDRLKVKADPNEE